MTNQYKGVELTLLDYEDVFFCAFSYYPGTAGSWYRRNGDPGDPPEAAEVEFTSIVYQGKEFKPSGDEAIKLEEAAMQYAYDDRRDCDDPREDR